LAGTAATRKKLNNDQRAQIHRYIQLGEHCALNSVLGFWGDFLNEVFYTKNYRLEFYSEVLLGCVSWHVGFNPYTMKIRTVGYFG